MTVPGLLLGIHVIDQLGQPGFFQPLVLPGPIPVRSVCEDHTAVPVIAKQNDRVVGLRIFSIDQTYDLTVLPPAAVKSPARTFSCACR